MWEGVALFYLFFSDTILLQRIFIFLIFIDYRFKSYHEQLEL